MPLHALLAAWLVPVAPWSDIGPPAGTFGPTPYASFLAVRPELPRVLPEPYRPFARPDRDAHDLLAEDLASFAELTGPGATPSSRAERLRTTFPTGPTSPDGLVPP